MDPFNSLSSAFYFFALYRLNFHLLLSPNSSLFFAFSAKKSLQPTHRDCENMHARRMFPVFLQSWGVPVVEKILDIAKFLPAY